MSTYTFHVREDQGRGQQPDVLAYDASQAVAWYFIAPRGKTSDPGKFPHPKACGRLTVEHAKDHGGRFVEAYAMRYNAKSNEAMSK